MRLIDADALIHEITMRKPLYKNDVVSLIANAPTIEPSKVDYRTEKSANIGTEVNDLISRADAIEAVCTWGTILERNGKTMMTMVDIKHAFIKTIEELPSADITETEVCQRCQESVERVLLNKATAEPTGDLISREDAIRILACEMYAEAQSEGYEVNSIEDYIPEARAWMNDAPSALPTADRPHGIWHDSFGFAHCSLCGFGVPRPIGKQTNYNYCPKCGAKLENTNE